MSFNFEKIENPVQVDMNYLRGFLNGKVIEIKREQNGWNIELVIKIDGITVHNHPANEQERNDFNELSYKAFELADKARKDHRLAIAPTIKELFA